jgi:4-hydroxybenzoate polyprenyltransferase
MSKTFSYLRLIRPANIVTSVADIIAGIAISGFFTVGLTGAGDIWQIVLLCISTAALYGGGIAFNDIFDAELDAHERPERPIPKGLVSLREAITFASLLLIAGIAAAFIVNVTSGVLAISIAVAALIYDKWGKHQPVVGPLNMGICRGLNLLLGMSIIPGSLQHWWFIAIVPVIYISAITLISRGEVHGSKRSPIYLAFGLYTAVIVSIMYFSFVMGMLLQALFFLLPFAWMIFSPLLRAVKEPTGLHIGKAVKAGVISLIIMDAAWAAASGEIIPAIALMLLFPLSFWLARLFAVT